MVIPKNVRISTITIMFLTLVGVMVLVSFVLTSMVISLNLAGGTFEKIAKLFSVDFERNIPTWVSAMLLGLAGLHFVLIAYCGRVIRKRYFAHWLIMGFIFFALSADEFIQFHEQIIRPMREMFNTGGFLYYPWILPAAILTAIVGIMYLGFIQDLLGSTRKIFILAAVVYVVGALGMEAVGGNYLDTVISAQNYQYNIIYVFLTHIEELLELIGIVLFLHFGMTYLRLILEPQYIDSDMLQPEPVPVTSNRVIEV
jgi:hypothetical protein